MIYEIPFTYPKYCSPGEIFQLLGKYDIGISAQTSWSSLPGEYLVKGLMPDLISFFRELDGPGQSFAVEEFKEYVMENNQNM